jgi:putative ABC transport system ATP-binding protein
MGIFSQLNVAGRTVVLITHEADIARYAQHVVRMRDGLIVADTPSTSMLTAPPSGWFSEVRP